MMIKENRKIKDLCKIILRLSYQLKNRNIVPLKLMKETVLRQKWMPEYFNQ